MPNPRPRDRFGRFNKRGSFAVIQGKLVRLKPKPEPRTSTSAGAPAPSPAGPGGVVVQRPRSLRKAARYETWFKAMGTTGELEDLRGRSPDIVNEVVEEYGAPAAWYSTQILGQVRFKGELALEFLIDELNSKLQFVGEGPADFDFRRDYPQWSYRYQVIEYIGPTERVVAEASDSRPRRGR